MSNDPHGIRRPTLTELQDADEFTYIAVTLRADIRARIAAAHDRVAVWQLRDCPPVTSRPASLAASSRRDG